MSLSPGTRVGPYEVTAQIGAGGMGEVCRARDTKLNRDVALKVLPTVFAADPDRMTRFQREAQLLAALNHPNIAAIYGLEDDSSTGSGQGGVRAIVMELVDGQTLTGPLPTGEALPIAKQIAEALEYAHERGIIHRDLKPANIKVTRDGSVKVLDFGLAKAMDATTDVVFSVQGTMSPTLSLAATQAGLILGTAAYMAPEQAKGKPVDRRADVWAFGVVFYEMLTGSRMFGGDSVPETLASVMKDQIALTDLPADTPASVRHLLKRCLERDPRRRLQSIGEARIVIEDAIAGGTADETRAQPAASGVPASKWPWIVTAAAVVSAVAAIGWIWSRPSPVAPPVLRYTIAPAKGTILTTFAPNAHNLAVSPDGRFVAYIADQTGVERSIWIHALDSLSARRVERTEGASFPFWSPDSSHIAYFANGKLMRVSLAGGAPMTVCDVLGGDGGTWFQATDGDGVIVFGTAEGPLSRVPARGGVPAVITTLADGEIGHSAPQFLAHSDRVLYLARGDQNRLYVHSLRTNERTFVMESVGRASFASPGFLLYLREGTLFAQRWDLDTLRLESEPVPIADDVRFGGSNGRNAFSISATGVVVYRSGGGTFQVNAYTRDGKPEGVMTDSAEFGGLELSPDEMRLLVSRGTRTFRDIWMKDLTSGGFSPLTTMPGSEQEMEWSPDSRRVAYSHTEGATRTWFQTIIGSGKHTPVPGITKDNILEEWTPDGQFLVVRHPPGKVSLIPAPREDGTSANVPPRTILDERYEVDQLRVSPNGKWVAYMSTESGRPYINVAAFPSFTDRRPVSTDAATQPLWRADGKELFFLGINQMLMSVPVEPDTLRIGPIEKRFQTNVTTTTAVHLYALSRNGQQVLIREPVSADGTPEPLYVVTNWTSLVR